MPRSLRKTSETLDTSEQSFTLCALTYVHYIYLEVLERTSIGDTAHMQLSIPAVLSGENLSVIPAQALYLSLTECWRGSSQPQLRH